MVEDSFETSAERFLKNALLDRGIISRNELAECIRERELSGKNEPLSILLIQKGYIKDRDLDTLLGDYHQFQANHQNGKQIGELVFGEAAIKSQLASSAEIWAALEFQERQQKKGLSPKLGEILVERGTLSISEARLVLEKQGKHILKCTICSRQYNVENFSPENTYTCRVCGGVLTDTRKITSVSVEGSTTDERSLRKSMDQRFIGRQVGQYKVIEKLGQGGMAVVYKAKHVILNDEVAVKVMLPELVSDSANRARFLREAQTAASLKHPNIVLVRDAGEDGEYLYIVMEMIDGQSLGSLVKKRRRIPQEEAADIILHAAKALAAACEKNLVHRDIKPDNIMLTSKGDVKVTDFGLAKSSEKSDMSLTASGYILGTPMYMSPEQFEAESLDPRSDIYSLGATFYHVLTGKPPFEATTVFQMRDKHLRETPKPLSEIVENIHPEIVRIVGKMLAKKRDERYPTPKELVADLESAKEILESGDEYMIVSDFIDVEKELKAPPESKTPAQTTTPAAAAPVPQPPAPPSAVTPLSQDTAVSTSRSKLPIILSLLAVVLVAAIITTVLLVSKRQGTKP
ncbi:MAG: serine/threonine-protein kinase, partial [Planctomycetota bacterium]